MGRFSMMIRSESLGHGNPRQEPVLDEKFFLVGEDLLDPAGWDPKSCAGRFLLGLRRVSGRYGLTAEGCTLAEQTAFEWTETYRY